MVRRLPQAWVAALLVGVIAPAAAAAHAEITPATGLAARLQLYTLAVPTEKSGATTSQVTLTLPAGFSIDSFAPPPPGWRLQVAQRGTGENAVVTRVTWSGGRTPTGQDAVFSFLAQPAAAQSYRLVVRQLYSDGSVVNWSGPESSDSPAPVVRAVKSLGGGGGGGTLPIVALVVAALALLVGLLALLGARGRELA